jgi:outer membrane protein assembly factor BamB
MIIPFLLDLSPLGVVPILVNAGAALFPAMIGALASVIALILKPRELMAFFRRKPLVPILMILVCVAVYFLIPWVMSPGQAVAGPRGMAATKTETDWSAVAIAILNQEQRAQSVATVTPVASTPAAEAAGGQTQSLEPNGQALIFRGNVARTGYLGGGSPKELRELWVFNEPNNLFLSSPLVAGDAVFGASAFLDPARSYGSVFRLDRHSGEPAWVTELKDSAGEEEFYGFFSSPALSPDKSRLLIGQGLHFDAGMELLCLDAQTGRVLWKLATPLHIEGSPAIEGDLVVAGAGAIEHAPNQKPKGDPAGEGHPGYVFAARISTGEEVWRYQINDPEGSPAIQDGVVYIGSGFNGSAVVALRLASDEELKAAGQDRLLWKSDTPFPATGAVSLVDGLVLIGCGNGDYVYAAPNPEGAVLAFDQRDGRELWRVAFADAVLASIPAYKGKAVCAVRNGELHLIDLNKQGAILWSTKLSTQPLLAGPAFTGEFIYAVSSDGFLYVVNASDGEVVERHFINDAGRPGELGLSISSPIIADGKVFVGSETGGLRCYSGTVSP